MELEPNESSMSVDGNDESTNLGLNRSRSLQDHLSYAVAIVGLVVYFLIVAFGKYFYYLGTLAVIAAMSSFLTTSWFPSSRKKIKYTSLTDSSMIPSSSFVSFWSRMSRRITFTHVKIAILIPLLINLFFVGFKRHLLQEFGSLSAISFPLSYKLHMHLANDFGKLSATAMSFFLIPITRHSIFLKAIRIHPIHAVQFHTFAGYIVVMAGLSHGFYWIYIWMYVRNDGIYDILPMSECWTWSELDDECHDRFVNVLGLFCGTCFVVLILTSLWWVRRNYYRVFYLSHVVCSICLLFGLVMHYNKMIWYLSPCLVYYFAMRMTIFVESFLKRKNDGIRILQAIEIPDSRGCVLVQVQCKGDYAINDSVELLEHTCGTYTRIKAPKISSIWHPFTIYTKYNDNSSLYFLFRSIGRFTTELKDGLTSKSSGAYPILLMDHLDKGDNQINQAIQHDSILIIAGGVGIVSYLSLIQYLLLVNSSEECRSTKLKNVIVHWSCRDEGLIRYISREFLELSSTSSIAFDIHVYHTNMNTTPNIQEIETSADEFIDNQIASQGRAFFVREEKESISFSFMYALLLFGSFEAVHFFYNSIQSKYIVYTRVYIIFVFILLAVLFAVITLTIENYSKKYSYNETVSGKSNHVNCRTKESNGKEAIENVINHTQGRPNIPELVKSTLHSSANLGVFVCGPPSFSDSIRATLKTIDTSKCTVYEESFEL
ncbi:hypothetical protein CTEN210_01052 [Chaetoceros tenuissimus]|uniref:FAD-binding FR-type domain-containing protein n=1 Tax=Chaetoceros tenuissimus TaxID=426638 RepID=A0AAD3CFB0_9STRA|nr:hypothetical protein CTEN210_01052 [Chaetoceros tenuissimus]